MEKNLRKKKTTASQHTQLPPLAIITVDMETELKPQATAVVEPVQQSKVHLFEVLLIGARNAGMADELRMGTVTSPNGLEYGPRVPQD